MWLHGQGRLRQAEAHYRAALELQPGFAAAYFNLGTALAALNRPEEAVVQYRKALAAQPAFPAALNNLGNALQTLSRAAESLEAFEKLLTLDPNGAPAQYGAGNALQALGRLEEAHRAYQRAVALAPGVPMFHVALADAKKFREGDPQLAVMENLARERLGEKERIALHFALAKAYDDLGRHPLAFEHLRSGNAIKRTTIAYDEAALLGAYRDIAQAFTSEFIDARRGQGDPSEAAIFIVGMPRSGTTLVEQVLASHPRVFGAGECDHLFDLVASGHAGRPFPFDVASLSSEALCGLGRRYLERLRSHAPEADRITDKLMINFRFVGLIHLALPKARIIHVRRDPVDTCFSCYTRLFPQGVEFGFDLGELGRHYRAYEALMAHWRRVLPQGAMLETRYEDLVTDFEAEARRIVDYCALEWDERCLRFHETKRDIYTASVQQVRRPLFKSSVGRSRPYREKLRPLLDALGVAAA